MAELTSKYMDDDDDGPDYNNMYDNIEEDDGEASEEFEVYNPDLQGDESSEVSEEESDQIQEGDDLLPKVDPYDAWDQVAEIDRVLDIQAVLLDDPALQEMLASKVQEDEANDASEEEDDDDEEEEEEEEENEEEDEDLHAALSTESESEIDQGIALDEVDSVQSLDDFESDAFSLGDVKSDPEDEQDNENEENEKVGEDEEEEDEQEQEHEEELVKKKLYRRISKLADSDTTEYETITSESENENKPKEDITHAAANQNMQHEGGEQIKEEKQKSPSPEPDPYDWIEYEKELDFIEEYDGDFIENYLAQNTQPSASSSVDESDDEKDTYDLPAFELPTHSVIKENQQQKNATESSQQKKQKNSKTLDKNPPLKKRDRDQLQVKKSRAVNGLTMKGLKPLKSEYTVDLNVYKFDKYPQYESPKSWLEKEVEEPKQEEEPEKEVARNPKRKSKRDHKMDNRKEGYFWKRRRRLEVYKRLHPEYDDVMKAVTDSDRPDEDIPSYKAKHRYLVSRKKTIEVVLNSVIQKTLAAVDVIEKARRRKEGYHYGKIILAELCDSIVADVHEKQQKDAVQYGIEVLLDKWEEHVYRTRMRLIEEQLDDIAEEVVTSSIKNCLNNIVDEDILSSLIVRDSLAESLKEIGMRPTRINRKLGNMFRDYQFDDYNFDSDPKKIKSKLYRTKKQLDSYLEVRSRKSVLRKEEENRAIEWKKAKENKVHQKVKQHEEELEASKKAVLKKKRILCPEEEKVEEDVSKKEPLNLTPDGSETESIGERRDTHEVVDTAEMSRLALQTHRRAVVINMWKNAHSQLIAEIREKQRQELEGKQKEEDDEEEEEEEKKDLAKIDFNRMYENDSEDEDEKSDDNLFEKDLPNLDDEIEKAMDRVVTPTKVHLVHAETGEKSESAIESEKIARQAMLKRRSTRLLHRESGIFSAQIFDEEEEEGEYDPKGLTSLEYEKEKDYSEIIGMIPKLDRDYYLQIWLNNGVSKVYLPSPPVSPNERKVRRRHLKRPTTAKSDDTAIEVAPADSGIFEGLISKGRLNSAMSNERLETSSSFYTGRESVFSVRDIDDDEIKGEEVEENAEGEKVENEDSRKTSRQIMYEKNVKNMKKIDKIEFLKSKPVEKNEKIEENDITPAWTFYRYRMNDVNRSKQKEKKKEFVTAIPPKELFENEKMEIIDQQPLPLEENLHEAFADDDLDDEIVQIDLNGADEEESDKSEENKNKKKGGRNSITPPSTPWQRDRQRPLTPDSADSEEELDNLKDKYINKHKQNREKEKSKHIPERKWKEYLKKKKTTEQEQPPPKLPKSGWKQTEPLIPWKNANEEVRKHKKVVNSNQDILINHNRELFQKLQIRAKREDGDQKLLERRGTMHQVGNKAEHRKQMGITSSPEDSRPPTTKSLPSYMRPTKSVKQREQQTKSRNGTTRFPAISGAEKRQNLKKTTAVS